MFDPHTFLMELYVMVDDFCQHRLEAATVRPGPAASLSCSEVVTLGLFSQWQRFRSERDFYPFAQAHLRSLFPCLPHRSQFKRLLRHHDVLAAFFVQSAQHLQGLADYDFCYEPLDTPAVPTSDAKRRGIGWLPEQAQIGWGNCIGAKSHGFYVSDKGFEDQECQQGWQCDYGACVLCPPKQNTKLQFL